MHQHCADLLTKARNFLKLNHRVARRDCEAGGQRHKILPDLTVFIDLGLFSDVFDSQL